jgi:hypothetical protein
MRRMVAGAALAAAFVVGSAVPALAGERGGNGAETPAGDKARSACAYSGLEDWDFEAPVVPGVTQNWGQIIREAGPLGGANSVLTPWGEEGCNAKAYPNK